SVRDGVEQGDAPVERLHGRPRQVRLLVQPRPFRHCRSRFESWTLRVADGCVKPGGGRRRPCRRRAAGKRSTGGGGTFVRPDTPSGWSPQPRSRATSPCPLGDRAGKERDPRRPGRAAPAVRRSGRAARPRLLLPVPRGGPRRPRTCRWLIMGGARHGRNTPAFMPHGSGENVERVVVLPAVAEAEATALTRSWS